MKKAVLILAFVLLLVVCAACGSQSVEADGTQTGSNTKSDLVDEVQAAEDLKNSDQFANRPYAGEIVDLEITGHETDTEAKTDRVYVTVKAETEWSRRTVGYILDYAFYDRQWHLTGASEDFEDLEFYEPLIGVDQATADAEYNNSEATMIQYVEDLPGYTCSYTYQQQSEHKYCTYTKQETLHYAYDTSYGTWNLVECTVDEETVDWDILGLWVSTGSKGKITSGWSEDITVEITEVGADYVHLIANYPGEGGIIYDGKVEFDPVKGLDCMIENPYDSWDSFGVVIGMDGASILGVGTLNNEGLDKAQSVPQVEAVEAPETEFTYTLDDETKTAVIRSYKGELSHLRIPDTMEGYTVVGIEEDAFSHNGTLEVIVLPETVVFIGEEAFSYCSSLKTINFPEGLVEIDDGAFENCGSLHNVILPQSLISLGEEVFADTDFDEITLPDGITAIPEGAFRGAGLHEITFGANVTSIGEKAFYGCGSLEAITIPGGVKTISESAFEDCRSLKELTIEEGVERIEKAAFYCAVSLVDVTIPDSVVEIDEEAFRACTSLKNLKLSASAKTIEWCAFASCEALETVVIPEGVVTLGEYAFTYCEELNIISLPKSLKSIEDGAFSYNDRLTTIHYAGTKEDWAKVNVDPAHNSALLEANMKYESTIG